MSSQELVNDHDLSNGSYFYDDNWYMDDSVGHKDDMTPEVIPDCYPTIPYELFHACIAPLSLAVLLALALLVKRKSLYQSCWDGAPGLLSPVNFLEEGGNKGLTVAVFGILFSSLCVLILDNNPLPFVPASSAHNREYWKIMALLYYPALYYPLIACATVRHRAGYLFGCLLSWCHCVVHIWQKVECPQSPKIYRYYSLLSYLPIILCLVVLSLWYPVQLVKSFRQKKMVAEEIPGSGYYKEYLKNVLAKRTPKGSASKTKPKMLSRLQSYLCSYIYTPQEGFQLPLKLVLSLAMAVIAVYQVALLLLVAFVPNIQIVRAGMTKELTALFVQFGLVPSENPAGIPGDKELATAKHYIWSLEVCFISSLIISCLLTFCILMKSLVNHRINLQRLYRGAVRDVFYRSRKLQPSQQALVCWMCFAGFQTAFTCLGLVIQHIVAFICTVGFTFLVAIPLQSGSNMHLFKIVENMWPFWLTLVVAVVAQNLLTHYCFLERGPLPKELTNRRALYIVTYLLFPINVLVGVLAGVWRMVVSALYNIIHFCQLDISLLSHGVEAFDPGYRTYCHFLKIEVSQSHPMMKAFCLLLLQLQSPEGPRGFQPRDTEEGVKLMKTKKLTSKASKCKQIRVRWNLAYTLLNNPSLLPHRKRALLDAMANGTQATPVKL
ncbi:receptor for retinol uptake STRA6 [Hemicordylus capensis]|uniref:receptor for retinol uptake STRA6 n=1 Tax=Hemicordylus capensis TaxID=884348 RepID=UPI002302417B|nr:receptor for retinol uptake STRA6 [Hemicordylus capensis]XP_053127690.1 receptor for retinol uptake STRA6 [Hemicordylus capensis]